MEDKSMKTMSQLERRFFRYLCRQTDYNRSIIHMSSDVVYVILHFTEPIANYISEFALKNTINYRCIADLINQKWLRGRNRILSKDSNSELVGCYRFDINSYTSDVYYNAIPARVIKKLMQKEFAEPMEENQNILPRLYTGSHIKPEEKRFFRYVVRQYDYDFCECEYKDGSYLLRIFTPPIRYLVRRYNDDNPSNPISKTHLNRIVRKWFKNNGIAHDLTSIEPTVKEHSVISIKINMYSTPQDPQAKYYFAIPANLRFKFLTIGAIHV